MVIPCEAGWLPDELVKKPGGLSAEVHTRIVYILQVDQNGLL